MPKLIPEMRRRYELNLSKEKSLLNEISFISVRLISQKPFEGD